MSRVRVAPIVEGHGEVEAVRILITRVWDMLGGACIEVLTPVRQPRGKLVARDGFGQAVLLARRKLEAIRRPGDTDFVLVLIDADEDCPVELANQFLEFEKSMAPGLDLACVIARKEYETWFVAAARSLGEKYLDLPTDFVEPEDPEGAGLGKAWIERRFRGRPYSETKDQPALSRAMNLDACRDRCPSFAKLWRELRRRLPTETGSSAIE